MRRQLAVMAALMLIAGLVSPARAATLALDTGTGDTGGLATLNLSTEGSGTFSGAQARIDLPPGVDVVAIKSGPAAAGSPEGIYVQFHTMDVSGHKRLAVAVISQTGKGTFTVGGVLAQITLSIAANAPVGTFPVTFVQDDASFAKTDASNELVDTLRDGSLVINRGTPFGDVNHDGSVNAVDVQFVVNAVLGIPVGVVDADVNADGSVNAVDIQFVINAVLGISKSDSTQGSASPR